MAGNKLPSVQSLEKPEDLNGLLRQDRGDDCLPCRVIGWFLSFSSLPSTHFLGVLGELNLPVGSGAFFGLAAYSYISGQSQLEKQRAKILQSKSIFGMRSRKLGIVSISLGLTWMGLWRLIN